MITNDKSAKRVNRCRIEWMRFLRPYEYVLPDKMLFQSNLTYVNDGQGFLLHIRTLAQETGILHGMVSQVIRGWPFVKKDRITKGMTILLWVKSGLSCKNDLKEQALKSLRFGRLPLGGQGTGIRPADPHE